MHSSISKTLTSKSARPPIHLVWICSELREKDVTQLKKWKALNRKREVIVWVETKYIPAVINQLKRSEVTIKTVESLQIPHAAMLVLNKYIEEAKLPANPGIPCDAFRLYILDEFGGGYFDFDIEPLDLDSVKVNPDYSFIVDTKGEGIFIPDAIVCPPKCLLIQNAIACFEAVVPLLANQDIIDCCRSDIASVRKIFTENTTGRLLNVAISTVLKQGHKIYNLEGSVILDPDLFETLQFTFQGTPENSWIKLPGVQIDAYYQGRKKYLPPHTWPLVAGAVAYCQETCAELAENRSDSIHNAESLALYKAAIKASMEFQDAILDCIGEYLWTAEGTRTITDTRQSNSSLHKQFKPLSTAELLQHSIFKGQKTEAVEAQVDESVKEAVLQCTLNDL